jgi:hypothetical protein
VDLKKLTERAKQLVDKRGGTESLKEDAEELRDIAGGRGSVTDKAKEAVEAIKDPGAAGANEPVRDPSRGEGEGRGRHEPGERGGRQARGRGHGEHRRDR